MRWIANTGRPIDFPSNGWEAPNLLCSDGEADPMEHVTSTDAKERLAELIERAAKGEDVCILDPTHGRIRLTPSGPSFEPKTPRLPERIPGHMQGMVSISKDELLAPLSAEELAWLSGGTSR